MTDNKRLAFSIIQFLHDQLQSGNLSSGAQESLEVAVQCLETAFEVSTDDQSLAVPMTLPEIFASATVKHPAQSQVNNNSTPNSISEEQRAEAERLKTDGNDQMKVENFGAAVEFYSKAIALTLRTPSTTATGLQPTVNWGTTPERCRTANRPSASTPTTAKPTAGWVWLWPASTNTQKQPVTIRKLWSSTRQRHVQNQPEDRRGEDDLQSGTKTPS
uniref:Small glutamine rich tetratricopeptide repeat co-chaperone alpha n=1 Tax=Lates calcarifer TaxID=8187 RepID=A0A4W6FGL6_LATCA